MDIDITDAIGQSRPTASSSSPARPTAAHSASSTAQATLPDYSTGTITFTFIPNDSAAPTAPTIYHIGGTIGFTDPVRAAPSRSPSSPPTITVYPQAKLQLNYFLQQTVIGDDPFTPQVEPSEPATLGLLVTNVGGGTANNLSITTAQPQIVQNEKGLARHLPDHRHAGRQPGRDALADRRPRQPRLRARRPTRASCSCRRSRARSRTSPPRSATPTPWAARETSLISSVVTHTLIHAGNFSYPGGTGATRLPRRRHPQPPEPARHDLLLRRDDRAGQRRDRAPRRASSGRAASSPIRSPPTSPAAGTTSSLPTPAPATPCTRSSAPTAWPSP